MQRKTTVGVELKCECEDGTVSWYLLREIKESDPVSTALHAKKTGLLELPTFAWWVPRVLRKKKHIEKKIVARLHVSKKFKYGIEVPSSVEAAEVLDGINDRKLWTKAIDLEMNNV